MDSFQRKMARRRRSSKYAKRDRLSDQDKKRLACLVREQPCVWKPGHPKYRRVIETAQAWSLISRKLAQPVRLCQTAWRSLKDGLRYRKLVAKEQLLQKSREEGSIPDEDEMLIEVDEEQMRLWKFWNVMRFYVDQDEDCGEDGNSFREEAESRLVGEEQAVTEELQRDPLEELGGESENDNVDDLDTDSIEDRKDQETFKLQLAPLVMTYPCLWQSSHPEYRKSSSTSNAWDYISEVLGRSVPVCKTGWKSLKDGLRYQKVVAKQQKEAVENCEIDIDAIELTAEQLQSWKFSGVMRFLITGQIEDQKREINVPIPAVSNVEERSSTFEADFSEPSYEATEELVEEVKVRKTRTVTHFHKPLSSRRRVPVLASEHCLVCYSTDNIVKKADVAPGSILSKHIHTIFILRNILEVPPKQLESFLRQQGAPDRWVSLCYRCSELITKAKTVFEMSLEIFKKYKSLKHSVIQRVKTSPSISNKTKLNNATDECRSFVKKRKYAPSTDPFISGDRSAQQLLFTNENEAYSQEEDYPASPAIKQEVVYDDDNFESCHQDDMILPDSPLTEKEKPSSKSNEDEDMEWVPDPEKSDTDQSDAEWKPPKTSSSSRSVMKSTSNSKNPRRKLYFKNYRQLSPIAPFRRSSKIQIRSFKCPICSRAHVKFSKGEILCEHLELCLPDNATQYADTGFPQLSCPLCKNFDRPVENKTEFAEHMAWCRLLKEATVGLKRKPNEIPLKCRVFQCSICPQKFMKLDAFMRHYLHHKRYVFTCTKCGKKYCSLTNAGHHYTTNHRDIVATLPMSERFTENRNLPLVHWWCPIPNCSEKFESDDERDLHYETCHGLESIPEKQHKCDLCAKAYLSRDDLRLHEGTMHVTELHLVSCDRCGESFATKELLKEHRMQKHRLDLFVCHFCGLELATKSTFKAHLQLHQEKKDHQCTQCEESFQSQEYLRYHVYRKHTEPTLGKNPLVCPICQKVLNSRPYLAKHIAHVHEKRYKMYCHICGIGVQGNSHLKRHLSRIHKMGEYGKHRCTVEGCSKVFYQKGLLEMHLSKHRQEPQFNCSFCGKAFYFKCQLKRHELIHKNADSKPYQCDICSKRYALRSYLTIHMKSHQNK